MNNTLTNHGEPAQYTNPPREDDAGQKANLQLNTSPPSFMLSHGYLSAALSISLSHVHTLNRYSLTALNNWTVALGLFFFFLSAISQSFPYCCVCGSETDKPEWSVCRDKWQRDSTEAAINRENTFSLVLKFNVIVLHL